MCRKKKQKRRLYLIVKFSLDLGPLLWNVEGEVVVPTDLLQKVAVKLLNGNCQPVTFLILHLSKLEKFKSASQNYYLKPVYFPKLVQWKDAKNFGREISMFELFAYTCNHFTNVLFFLTKNTLSCTYVRCLVLYYGKSNMSYSNYHFTMILQPFGNWGPILSGTPRVQVWVVNPVQTLPLNHQYRLQLLEQLWPWHWWFTLWV